MTEALRANAGELPPEEILTALHDGRRVILLTEMLGTDHEVVLRHDGGVYYCDTPTTLHKHESTEAMRQCLENQGYASE